ncbi:MAG: tRNA (adenosine(37)-N6)-threonylcarbamoyltransferase complex ATPase subunit type 1 TsaE [Pseudomonadota bacterium]
MPETKIKLLNDSATQLLGAAIGEIASSGDFIALYGDLGAGKTTFARGFIQDLLGPPTEVPSPTFTLLQTYDAPNFQIFHFDLYRLKSPDEVWELGWEEIGVGVTLCEWPENAGEYLPAKRLEIHLEQDAAGRMAVLRAIGYEGAQNPWKERLIAIMH